MKRTVLFTGALLSLVGVPHVRAQSIGPATLNATGGTAPLAGNIYDWSVGEMTMVSTFTGSSVIVTQGLLQPELLTSGISGAHLAQHLEVFPTPANSWVNVRLTSDVPGKLSYRLFDMTGKLIKTQSADARQGVTSEQLDISTLAVATYMLEVSFWSANEKQETTSYKIEKLK
jgi:Secretion system C-terminal sorting domain